MVDAENMCWYHECTLNSDGTGLESIPRRCALGSKVSYNFIRGNFNPCTYNFDDVIGKVCFNLITDEIDLQVIAVVFM